MNTKMQVCARIDIRAVSRGDHSGGKVGGGLPRTAALMACGMSTVCSITELHSASFVQVVRRRQSGVGVFETKS